MSFCNVLEHKTILKSYKTWNFRENSSKIAFFSQKMSQKGPRDLLEPPRTMKTVFLELPGYENPIVKKIFLNYFP